MRNGVARAYDRPVMRTWMVLGIAAAGLVACDRVEALLTGSPTSAPTASATASASAPAGDWKTTKAFDGRWRVADSSGHRDGGFAFQPHLGQIVVIEGGVMAFLSKATGQQSQLRKTLRVARSGGGGDQRVFIEHRGHFYDHDAMSASAESVGASSKGWSRHGLARIEGDVILLSVTPPGTEPPTSFESFPDEAEVVRLERSDPATEEQDAGASAGGQGAGGDGEQGGGGRGGSAGEAG